MSKWVARVTVEFEIEAETRKEAELSALAETKVLHAGGTIKPFRFVTAQVKKKGAK